MMARARRARRCSGVLRIDAAAGPPLSAVAVASSHATRHATADGMVVARAGGAALKLGKLRRGW